MNEFIKPKSGGLKSFALGGLAALASLIGLIEFTLPTDLSAQRNDSPRSNKPTQISWDIKPVLPQEPVENFFVEANSEVPENLPDDTPNFSFRDQQAAQPELSDSTSPADTPKVSGEIETSKIAEAEKQTQESPPDLSQSDEEIRQSNEAHPQKALPSKSELEGLEQEGIALQSKEEQGKEQKTIILAEASSPKPFEQKETAASQPRQKPRPKLSPELIRGPIMKSSTIAPRVGTLAIECRLHPYGVYLQEMLKSIEEQWHQLATGSIRFLQKDRLPGTLTFRFKLLSSGNIENLSRLDSEGQSLPAELCRQAIASRVPFGEWSQSMIKDFGKSDEVTISFRYQ